MKASFTFCAFLILGVFRAHASLIAIVDSGTDMLHKDIAPQAWVNAADSTENNVDDDENGFTDDINGWNFAENNNMVIDRKYLGRLTPDIRRFFEVQSAALEGTATDEDIQWAREKIKDQSFLKELMVYANFMHGTHVGSIAIAQNAESQIMAVKLIPTEVGMNEAAFYRTLTEDFLLGLEEEGNRATPMESEIRFEGEIGVMLLKYFLRSLAERQMESLKAISSYLNGHKVDISNFSFGTGYTHAKQIVEQLAKQFIEDPTEEQIDEITRDFVGVLLEKGVEVMAAAPNTLFVIAAGNEGISNDDFPCSPANVRVDNTISVAATLGDTGLARFSNYGVKMVDVGAPGVAIVAAVPGDKYLPISGTSQSAPYVSGVASQIKDANPALTPAQVKEVIMKTVDLRNYLKGRVKSGGIVNNKRAIRAAHLSLILPVADAIASAIVEVADPQIQAIDFGMFDTPVRQQGADLVLPLNSPFAITQ